MTKTFIWIGLLVGSTLGGFVPALWGGDLVSLAGIALSTVGGVVGIVLGYKFGQSVG